MLLNNVLTPSSGVKKVHLVILEHDLTRSTIPILRDLIQNEVVVDSKKAETKTSTKTIRSVVILVTFLHPPNVFVRQGEGGDDGINGIGVVQKDYTGINHERNGLIPSLDIAGLRKGLMENIEAVPPNDSMSVIVDSVDTMAVDTGSNPGTLLLLQDLAEKIRGHKTPSRLILSISSTSSLLSHLLPPSFSQSLAHLRLFHPSILLHLHKTFLLPPPPLSNLAKFHSVFLPFVQRERKETESVFYNATSDVVVGISTSEEETVVEVAVRSVGLRKGVERELVGWNGKMGGGGGACTLEELISLRSCFVTLGPSSTSKSTGVGIQKSSSSSDPTLNLPFNLSLTAEQHESRARVPLPYAHTGEIGPASASPSTGQASAAGAIYYDPDSADDLDEEDPDEDLDL